MKSDNYILAYYQAITEGKQPAGRWIKLLYERILEGLESKTFFYDQKKAAKAIAFIETFCRHHEGALGGQLIRLELWQKAFLSCLFGIVDENGIRVFAEVLLTMGRKNGKTLLSSAIATYEAYADGEYGARVYMAAPKLQQANICYDQCYQTIKKEPELERLAKKRRTDIYIEHTNSSIAPLAFSEKKSDGLNVSCAILDEVASWHGPAGMRFYEVLKSSVGARKQPLILGISTSGYENDGVFDALVERGTKWLLGNSKETHFLPVLYMIDDIEKWDDINEIAKANPNLNVSVTARYLIDELAIAEESLSKKSEFLTKYCCVKQNSVAAWISNGEIKKIAGEPLTLEMFKGCYCVGGIDLSQTTDLTSACVVIERGGRLFTIWHFWMPSEKLEEAKKTDGVPYDRYIAKGWLTLCGENFVDYKAVFEWFGALVKNYKILPLQIGYDRYSSQYLIQDLEGAGFHCDDVFQGFNLSGVIKEAEGLIKDETLIIGDNELAKIHLLDTAIEADNRNNRVRIKKVNRTVHIDGTAALLCALTVRQKWHKNYAVQLSNAKHGALDYKTGG